MDWHVELMPLDLLASLVRSHSAGIGFAGGLVLLMLAVCFAVGHRLRPNWGLAWLSVAMLAAALRGVAAAAGLLTPDWRFALASLAAAGLAALVAGLRQYVGRSRWHPALEFLAAFLVWHAVTELARYVGLGGIAGVLTSLLIYLYLAALCLPLLGAVSGRSHYLVAAVLVLHPFNVVVLGLWAMALDPLVLHSWSVLSQALLGMGLLMAAAGRLRVELQTELEGRESAEAQLRQLNNSLEQRILERTAELEGLVEGLDSFNRMVSHDLRGPLGGLAGVAVLARQALELRDIDRADQLLVMIQAETTRLGSLVMQLLTLARVSNAEISMQRTPLDAVLTQALQSLTLTLGSNRTARVALEPLPHAVVDAELMRQVFINLVANALKFSERSADPQVWVREAPRPDGLQQVVIEVSDNGPGFDAAQADQLFQPFKRLHGANVEGHGIGLTIVRRVVERHGGMVWAEGRPGLGASFYFSLPAGI